MSSRRWSQRSSARLVGGVLGLSLFASLISSTGTAGCRDIGNFYGIEAHRAITEDLFRGTVIDAVPFRANGNNTEIIKVTIRDPDTGRVRDALFKPRIYGDFDGYGRTPGEYLAYRMNLLLGMDYVPPVAYRHNVEVNFKHYDEGAFLYLVPDAHNLKDVPQNEWGERIDLFFSDTRILDTLIQNPDRHDKNFIRGKHWTDGTYRPMLIDHAAAMRRGTMTSLDQWGALGSGPIKVVRKTTWTRLHELSFERLKRDFGEFYSDAELGQMMRIRDGMIGYFTRLAQGSSWDRVVIDQ